MDTKSILDAADAETVAEYLQMKIVPKGKNKFIRCPGHKARVGKEDTNIGNAVLRHKGYMCFACNQFVSTRDMVMEYTGCSSDEAVHIIANAMGISDSEEGRGGTDDYGIPRLRLNQTEAKVIGLSSLSKGTVIQKVNAKGTYDVVEGLYILYEQEPDLYYKIIVQKAEQARDKYKDMLEHYAKRSGDRAYVVFDLMGDNFDSSIYRELEMELKDRIDTCEKVMRLFGTGVNS